MNPSRHVSKVPSTDTDGPSFHLAPENSRRSLWCMSRTIHHNKQSAHLLKYYNKVRNSDLTAPRRHLRIHLDLSANRDLWPICHSRGAYATVYFPDLHPRVIYAASYTCLSHYWRELFESLGQTMPQAIQHHELRPR